MRSGSSSKHDGDAYGHLMFGVFDFVPELSFLMTMRHLAPDCHVHSGAVIAVLVVIGDFGARCGRSGGSLMEGPPTAGRAQSLFHW